MLNDLDKGILFHKQGKLKDAELIYQNLLISEPNNFQLLNLIGAIYFQQKKFYEAISSFSKALKINNKHHAIYNNLGSAYKEVHKFDEAILNLKKAIELNPYYAEGYNNLGITYRDINKVNESKKCYEKAIELKPNYAEAYNNLGILYGQLLLNYEKSIIYIDQAIKLKPNYTEAYNQLGIFFSKLKKFRESIQNFSKAIELDPNYIDAYINRANVYNEQNNFFLAIEDCLKLIRIDQKNIYIYESLIFIINNKIGNWKNYDKNLKNIKKNIIKYKSFGEAITPFYLLSIFDVPRIIKKYTYNHIELQLKSNYFLKRKTAYKNSKIRLGYFSPDFRNHAVSYLIADVLKYHDKKKFEIYGFNFGNFSDDFMTKKIKSYCSNFINIKGIPDKDLIMKAKKLKIDIAVDICGLTKNNKINIFYNRIAPIQVNFLGYPGTLGSFMDYIIADKNIIPEKYQKYYFEKIIYMPISYQPYSIEYEKLNIFTNKKNYLIPEKKFVYCCFNSSHKINLNIFKAWINILKNTKNSVLVILDNNLYFKKNLLNLMHENNLDKNRLIFTPFVDQKFVFDRYKQCDLFLDTFPYGGHTTTREALISGLPVLTIGGKSFQSRVGLSLLSNIKMNDLIKFNIKDYESFAIYLGNNVKELDKIKKKLSLKIFEKNIFDSKIFSQHLESAYIKIFEKNKLNLKPENIYIN